MKKKVKTKTGALPSSAGFPVADQVKVKDGKTVTLSLEEVIAIFKKEYLGQQ